MQNRRWNKYITMATCNRDERRPKAGDIVRLCKWISYLHIPIPEEYKTYYDVETRVSQNTALFDTFAVLYRPYKSEDENSNILWPILYLEYLDKENER